jgi:hypothetical protein
MILCRLTCRLSPRLVRLLGALAIAALILLGCQGEPTMTARSGAARMGDTTMVLNEVLDLDQRLTIRVARDWQRQQQHFNDLIFLLDADGPALLKVKIDTYEFADDIAADRLARHIDVDGNDDPALYARDRLATRIFHYDTQTDSGNRLLVWRRAMVLGDYLRIADFALHMPRDKWESPSTPRLIEAARLVVEEAEFPADLAPTDRIGAAPQLKQTSVHAILRFRVPKDWTRSRTDEGWTRFSPPDASLGFLETNWDHFSHDLPDDVPNADFLLVLKVFDHFPDLIGKKTWSIYAETNESAAPPERVFIFRHAVTRRKREVVVASFRYRVPLVRAEDRAVKARIALLKRELRKTVIAFPEKEDGGNK